MGAELVFDIGQNPGGLITCGLNDLTVQLGQSRCHQCMPGVLIASLSEVFQNNEITHRLGGHQAQSAREGFVLGHGDDFAGHVLGQARGFSLAVIDDGLFDLKVDLLLRSIGSGDKPVQTREVEQETDQTNATSTDLDTDQMEG